MELPGVLLHMDQLLLEEAPKGLQIILGRLQRLADGRERKPQHLKRSDPV
ncbi:hypothetical protein StoSoilA2_07840 [Arthrobacter sp. StoSoilA2]|nr:hypothetical protein StoSoilA2_07840 [Arthrobacter sp. StoSoilA2]